MTKGVEELFLRSEGAGGRGWGKDARNWVVVWGEGVWGSQSGCTERVCVCRVHEEKAETKSWSPLVHLGCFYLVSGGELREVV